MPVQVESAISGPYTPNGVTTTFAFTFKAGSSTEVAVVDQDGNALSSALFSVDLDNDEGGSVTFSVAPSADDYDELYIISDPSLTQTADFDNTGSSFNPASLTRALDRAAIRDLKQQAEIDRAFKVPFGETGPTFPTAAARANLYPVFDADGNLSTSAGTGADLGMRTDLASTGGDLVGNQLPAGANLRTQMLSEFIEGSYLMPSQFDGTEEERLVRAIAEGAEVRDNALGHTVLLPRGVIETTAPFNMANRVALRGVNKRGSIIRAASGFVGSYMATVVNGTVSTFDNGFEDLTIDCNDVAGLSAIDSQAWQEGGGIRRVLIDNFRTYAIRFRDGFGGASTCLIRESEIFGSSVASADTAVRIEQVSSLANFLVKITDSTITGSTGFPLTYGVWVENDSLHCSTVHFEEAETAIYLDGVGNHILSGVTGASTVTNLVEIAPTFTGSLVMIGCFRGGATNLLKDNRAGGLGTISYDISEIRIEPEPALALGQAAAGGNFDGSGTPNIDNCFGTASITKNGTGDYTITLSRAGINANSFAVFVSSNHGGPILRTELTGAGSVRIYQEDTAGSPVDANEVKFLVVRVA